MIDYGDVQTLLKAFRVFMKGNCLEVLFELIRKQMKKDKGNKILKEFTRTFKINELHKQRDYSACAKEML